MHAIPFYLVFVMPLSALVGLYLGGLWPLLTPALVFVVIPLLDLGLGHDRHNAGADEVESRRSNPLYELALLLWIPAQLGVFGWGLHRAGQGLGWSEGAALVACLSIVATGGGINVAHELMHRRSRGHRALAEVLMLAVSYPWFCVEHVLGHHRRVGTDADPATSTIGQPVYDFLPRAMAGSLRSAWDLEGRRCARRGIAATSLANRRLRYALGMIVVWGGVAGLAGPGGLLVFVAQSFASVFMLETINYIEHYGLRRLPGPDGRIGRVQPIHSWNSTHRLSGWFLFMLPRHSDHHAVASRPYWALQTHDDVPEMPFGYPTMMLIAWVPPLWFALMDGRARAVTSAPTRKLRGGAAIAG